MMEKISHIVDVSLLTIGLTYSLDNIKTTLGIIILAIQLIWIVVKLVYNAVKLFKGDITINEANDDVIGSLSDIKHTLEQHTEKEEEVNGNETDGKE